MAAKPVARGCLKSSTLPFKLKSRHKLHSTRRFKVPCSQMIKFKSFVSIHSYCTYWFYNVLSGKSVVRAFVQWLLLAGWWWVVILMCTPFRRIVSRSQISVRLDWQWGSMSLWVLMASWPWPQAQSVTSLRASWRCHSAGQFCYKDLCICIRYHQFQIYCVSEIQTTVGHICSVSHRIKSQRSKSVRVIQFHIYGGSHCFSTSVLIEKCHFTISLTERSSITQGPSIYTKNFQQKTKIYKTFENSQKISFLKYAIRWPTIPHFCL
jgi:hypothetical protein